MTDAEEKPAPAPQDRPLFRPEAIAYHLSGRRGPRRRLDLDDRASRIGYWLLVLMVAGTIVTAFTVHADETANGAGRVQPDGRVQLLLSGTSIGRLREGQRVVLRLPDGGTVEGEVLADGKPFAQVPGELGTGLRPGAEVGVKVVLTRRSLAEIVTGRGSD